MAYLTTFHLGWLIGAFAIGLAMGWISVVQRGEGLSIAVLQRIAAAAAVLIVLALTNVIPGRAGYWLDLALVMIFIYLAGCVAGALLRHRVVSSRMIPAAKGPTETE